MIEPKFKIGDRVWRASFEIVEKKIVCDDCRGDGRLVVIMGDNSSVSIECTGCKSGFDGSRGYNIIHDWVEQSKPAIISKIEISSTEVQYQSQICQYSNYTGGENTFFATEKEANIRAAEMGKEHQDKQLERLKKLKHNHRHSWAHNATYHRSCIKHAKIDLEYHTAKLQVASLKAKKPKEPEKASA